VQKDRDILSDRRSIAIGRPSILDARLRSVALTVNTPMRSVAVARVTAAAKHCRVTTRGAGTILCPAGSVFESSTVARRRWAPRQSTRYRRKGGRICVRFRSRDRSGTTHVMYRPLNGNARRRQTLHDSFRAIETRKTSRHARLPGWGKETNQGVSDRGDWTASGRRTNQEERREREPKLEHERAHCQAG
jgi:hypothetical protein